jgi:dye decolorizing peroxidase
MLTRRQILLGTVAATGAGVAATISGAAAAEEYRKGFAAAELASETKLAKSKTAWSGDHQAGVESHPQAHTNFIALDLKSGITKSDMLRWMVILTDDISRMCNGIAALADPAPELVVGSANLSITVGFGPAVFEKLNLQDQIPKGFAQLPGFAIDELDKKLSDGDVLIHVGADDLQLLSHLTRNLINDSNYFADLRWLQSGFTQAVGTLPAGTTQRNLMGQVDGTDNPEIGSNDFANRVWISDGPAWAIGGTQLALRRIKMNLNTWNMLGRTEKEEVIGRHLDSGAPLGKKNERDPIDFEATRADGLQVIPPFAHIRRASAQNPDEIFFRRPFNYQVLDEQAKELESGLLWTAYAKDLTKQYLPVQQRLAKFDLLNKWTTPIGSSVFAIAAGFKPGEVLAEKLFG